MKLTAVTLRKGGRLIQTFVMLPVVDGKTVLCYALLDKMLSDLGVRCGDTFTSG